MRNLLFTSSELGLLGGLELTVLGLAETFTKRGCPTGIVELAPNRKSKRLTRSGIPVWSVTAPSFPRYHRPRSWASFARAVFQFEKVLHEFRPDVVHVHFPGSQSLPAVGAHLLPHRWRLVVTLHGSDVRVLPFTEPGLRSWHDRLFGRADAVTAVSKALLETAQRSHPSIAAKGRVIHNGVGNLWFKEAETKVNVAEKYALFVGRFHSVKGLDLLLSAWKRICPQPSETKLWLVGHGPELENMRALTEKLDVSSSVRFLGQRQREDLPSFYRGAELIVVPSRDEGLGLIALEAGACGAVCVGTRVGGIPEVIEDRVTGFLVEPESPEALARGISQALQLSPAERRAMGRAAQERIRKDFTEERMISNYLGLYESLLIQNF